ncbi:MAG: Palmitoyltransferase [Vezdaea aestivalis]|nr:MAG: Palmitoyltransferase [Vezdaea aestivalis]
MAFITNPAQLAIPAVSLLICFLSYSSQVLFHYLAPGPLTTRESLLFNTLIACIWISYYRTCTLDPGLGLAAVRARLAHDGDGDGDNGSKESAAQTELESKKRWCKKCEGPKPERAHHCKVCKRCVPKMDHHCPWTGNCVSYSTLPHFVRFLGFAVASMVVLGAFVWTRLVAIWNDRFLPSYLGPPIPALVHLTFLTLTLLPTILVLSVLLFTTLSSLFTNTTTIESWEISRHRSLLRRARLNGGYVDGQDGQRIRLVHREFPFDIGFWRNLVQVFGTRNVLRWGLVFGGGEKRLEDVVDARGRWERNGFENEDFVWPPPDPDRLPVKRTWERAGGGVLDEGKEGEDWVRAFRERQSADTLRFRGNAGGQRVVEVVESDEAESGDQEDEDDERLKELHTPPPQPRFGGPDDVLGRGWRNDEGERLDDFGVDEDEIFD